MILIGIHYCVQKIICFVNTFMVFTITAAWASDREFVYIGLGPSLHTCNRVPSPVWGPHERENIVNNTRNRVPSPLWGPHECEAKAAFLERATGVTRATGETEVVARIAARTPGVWVCGCVGACVRVCGVDVVGVEEHS